MIDTKEIIVKSVISRELVKQTDGMSETTRYYEVVDQDNIKYYDWRGGKRHLGAYPLVEGSKYIIEITYSENGKFKKIYGAWVPEK